MKIWFVSDLHFERFRPEEVAVLEKPDDADVMVVAGDTHKSPRVPDWVLRQRNASGIPIVIVAGNHEHYGQNTIYNSLSLLREVLGREEGIHFLENDTATIGDCRFVGATMWTDFLLHGEQNKTSRMTKAHFHMNDYAHIRTAMHKHLTPADTLEFHERTRREFTEMLNWYSHDGPTIFVTHHMPHPLCGFRYDMDDILKPAYASDMSDIMLRDDGPDLWISGHGHESYDFEVGQCRVVANPRGYADKRSHNGFENLEWDPLKVIDTDLLPRFRTGVRTP
ncbi:MULTISPECIES: metallophosphoesterase [unclassified Pannonibacter]|uniref:metallophosphoesterase n=1 Tax=unclassified Pannonibacter TaxID=2627228 RepID=UPI0016488165|nr:MULTISPECIES: metallophosphoesterase [unclassified Pannonibacter]